MKKILAIDASTEVLSIALGQLTANGIEVISQHTSHGGAKASKFLINDLLQLLQQANWQIQQLDYIAFGEGPGSFTGLRTSCSVVQGIAMGCDAKVIPISTLAALAQQAWQHIAEQQDTAAANASKIVACLDARMHEIYYANFQRNSNASWQQTEITLIAPALFAPDADAMLVGNIFSVYAEQLTVQVLQQKHLFATPMATAMLQLVPNYLATQQALPAEKALPVYIRNKVALTTAERVELKNKELSRQ